MTARLTYAAICPLRRNDVRSRLWAHVAAIRDRLDPINNKAAVTDPTMAHVSAPESATF